MADGGVWVRVYPDAGGGAPGAAVIGGATGAVTESSFTENGQAYDVYEFTGSGELVVSEPGFVDALLVGGGAGGGQIGGGGGAGGFDHIENIYVEGSSISLIVGGGGNAGAPGTSSKFSHLWMPGGGAGGNTTNAGAAGSSGGGAGKNNSVIGIGLDGIGNNGGAGGTNAGGGGGGATSAGVNANGSTGGNGGAGTDASLFIGQSAGTLLLAGGGGGGSYQGTPGTGGSGGGGNGSTNNAAEDGLANSGSGGGGGGWNSTHGAVGKGGSGIVIVRVKVASESYPFRTRSTAPRTAHAARIEDGIVRQVIVIPHLDDDDAKITAYCNSIGLTGTWVDTSYTGSRRGKYAGVGDLFDPRLRNAEFISPVEETE